MQNSFFDVDFLSCSYRKKKKAANEEKFRGRLLRVF